MTRRIRLDGHEERHDDDTSADGDRVCLRIGGERVEVSPLDSAILPLAHVAGAVRREQPLSSGEQSGMR